MQLLMIRDRQPLPPSRGGRDAAFPPAKSMHIPPRHLLRPGTLRRTRGERESRPPGC